MADMGWSQYIRGLDNAAHAEEQAREQDMLPWLVKFCDYDSPHSMYRAFYKYTDCGPWVSVHVHLASPIKYVNSRGELACLRNDGDWAWVHCGDLHKLGTWDEMSRRGDIVDELLIGSIVEGSDAEAYPVPVRLTDVRSKRSKRGTITRASLRSAFDRAVAAVNEEACALWEEANSEEDDE